jgi:hypothetical protein
MAVVGLARPPLQTARERDSTEMRASATSARNAELGPRRAELDPHLGVLVKLGRSDLDQLKGRQGGDKGVQEGPRMCDWAYARTAAACCPSHWPFIFPYFFKSLINRLSLSC